MFHIHKVSENLKMTKYKTYKKFGINIKEEDLEEVYKENKSHNSALNMGFKVDNSMFLKHSLYYRNALVRSNYADYSQGVLPTMKYLEQFYENLLFRGQYILSNRELMVYEYLDDIRKLVKEDTIYNGIKIL